MLLELVHFPYSGADRERLLSVSTGQVSLRLAKTVRSVWRHDAQSTH